MEETYIGKKGQLMTTRDGKPYALQTKTGKEIKHGTGTAYSYYGCRCVTCSLAQAELGRKYREENREKELERGRKYREENRERMLERSRKYHEENRERMREWDRKYHEENRERRLERSRKYREENPTYSKIARKRGWSKFKSKNDFSKGKASRSGLPYTEQEDALLLSQPISLALALEMGRSLESVSNRKEYLRKKLREQGIDPDTMQPLDNQD